MEKLFKCSSCHGEFPLSDFSKRDSKKCKKCRNEINRKWREQNPERARELNRLSAQKYREANREKVNEGHKEYRKRNHETLLIYYRQKNEKRKLQRSTPLC